jgi:Ni/Co efflux regulator RcnB
MLLLGTLLATASTTFAAPQTPAATGGTQSYEVKDFVADFTKFTIGDTVPEMYRSEEYNIKQWNLRNLPAPDPAATGPIWVETTCLLPTPTVKY